ncbi:MAG TPA: hypothetical protein VMD02_03680 [Candidatus Omnitrophota bacterium]|nr:hypothetical protein [Candidatus Omnitrophota bacterium]
MKKAVMILLILGVAVMSMAALTGCQQASNSSNSSNTTSLPSSSASSYAQTATGYADSLISSMTSWATGGSISGLSVKSAAVGGKSETVSGPDTNGYYTISGTTSIGTYETITYNVHAKLAPSAVNPTEVDVYGTIAVDTSYAGVTYTVTYGGGISNPLKGTLTWNAGKTDVTNVALNGSLSMEIKAGSDTTDLTISFSGLSVPIGGYPTGTVTVAITNNGAAQPDLTLTYNGTSTVTWAYNGSSGSYTISAASVKK